MLKQKDILEVVISLLKKKYPKPETGYYTDEVVKGFKQPCFFVKLIKSRNLETKNTNSNMLSIAVNYFASPSENKQLAFLDCEDTIGDLIGKGFQVGNRFLHAKSISAERIGENQDILQLTISIEYLDSNGYQPDSGFEIMEELKLTLS